jgi:hypothetical protein
MIGLIIQLGIIAAVFAGFWKVFEKAGRPGWEGIVPIYNLWILVTKIIGKKPLWFILCLIPLINIIALIVISLDVARCFGKGTGFGVGLLLLGFVFYPILGFGDAKYQGPVGDSMPGGLPSIPGT